MNAISMAESNLCNTDDLVSKDSSVRVLWCVFGGILSFSIPTKGNSICLKLADALVKGFGSPSVKFKEFGDWSAITLQEIIDTSRRRRGKTKDIINQEKLWNKYHMIISSESFKISWETFLSDLQLEKEPVFYQHVTDETFDILIKKAVVPIAAPMTNSPVSLTYEEENAVRYVGGYIYCTSITSAKGKQQYNPYY